VIELDSVTIRGLRSLENAEDIPVRRPTIITGANDGGKSTTLKGTAFLLGAWTPTLEDFTKSGPSKDGTEALAVQTVEVEGRFALDATEAGELNLDRAIRVRRIADQTLKPHYELYTVRPVRVELRDLERKKIADLKQLAEDEDIPPDGPRNLRESFLSPLREHVADQPVEEGWEPAPSALIKRLPIMMMFSSTDEPDPEAQIQAALRTAYTELLTDASIVAPVHEAEKIVQDRLSKRARELCDHVAERCPELSAIEVVPRVTFREGFGGVSVLASRPGGLEIPLDQSGAGRRRRVNLAIWEWTGNLVQPRATDDRAVVIAYDEPDTHLDYSHQRQLVSLIHEQCEQPGIRMLVATHSLNLIDRVDIEDVVHLRIVDERTTAERLMSGEHDDINRHLAAVSDAMGLRNSVLLHERCFVGVEGPTEMQALPLLFRLVTGMSLQSAGIALISGNGNDGALLLVKFLKQNGRRLAFILVDSDSSDGKLFRPDKLQAQGIKKDDIWFVGKRELEDTFTDDQWAAVANHNWKRTDGLEWSADDFATLRSSAKFSSALQHVVRGMSVDAPSGKPGYLFALAQGLKTADEVPADLIRALTALKNFSTTDRATIADDSIAKVRKTGSSTVSSRRRSTHRKSTTAV
jgi:hypothetical protein